MTNYYFYIDTEIKTDVTNYLAFYLKKMNTTIMYVADVQPFYTHGKSVDWTGKLLDIHMFYMWRWFIQV
jgi:hypothetical protein